MSASADRAAIEAALPHRDPFLFVDRVADAGDGWIETTWRVPAGADWFRGHYPGRPVMPGVLICEHVFQSGALLAARLLTGATDRGGVPVLTKIDSARFRRIVAPGEELATRVELADRAGPALVMRGDVRCGSERVLRVGFTVTATGAVAALDL